MSGLDDGSRNGVVDGAPGDTATAPRQDGQIIARRVGPGARPAPPGERTTSLAADNHLAAALLTLWQRVSDADGAVGFEPGTPRNVIARAVTEAISGLRAGTRHAVVLTAGNDLVGVAFLVRRPSQIQRHLGEVVALMVDPDVQRAGLGRRLVVEIAGLATEIGVDTLLLGARDREPLHAFCQSLGFIEYGRLPDAVRLADGTSLDEVRYRRVLAG